MIQFFLHEAECVYLILGAERECGPVYINEIRSKTCAFFTL